LSSVALGKEGSAHSVSVKPSLLSTFSRALGEVFAECQEVLDKEKQPSRRRVTETASLPSVLDNTRQRSYLCRVSVGQHSAKNPPAGPPCQVFCRVLLYGTQQSVLLCQVSEPLHSAKNLYRCPGLGSLPSAMVWALGKETSTHLFYLFFLFYPNKQKIFHRYHIYTSQIITDIYSQHKH
jgi:hypothetical protein